MAVQGKSRGGGKIQPCTLFQNLGGLFSKERGKRRWRRGGEEKHNQSTGSKTMEGWETVPSSARGGREREKKRKRGRRTGKNCTREGSKGHIKRYAGARKKRRKSLDCKAKGREGQIEGSGGKKIIII